MHNPPNPPVLSGMPDFHDSVEYLRYYLNLSRESTAQKAGFSSSHLNQLIWQRKIPGPKVFEKLVRCFGLTPAQQRHLQDLLQPSVCLPPTDELRRRLTARGVQAHLDYLGRREVLGAYLDPLQTVLHGNEVLHRMMPGLDMADNNIVQWMLTPIARERVDGWASQLLYQVRTLRAALGRYRGAPRARALFQTLRTDIAFRSSWDATPMQVSDNGLCSPLLCMRIPGMRQPLSLNLEINEYEPGSELFIVHGLYSTHAIAC
ncbi:hypothetical protein V7968_02455 [Nocardia vulneris]|uniref:MmyB family transcriptional regulator n=1 Tax=Nocardia vulneris TaxID=1141657 RepID=UPI0030CEE36F